MLEFVLATVIIVASLALYALFTALPVMWLWNWLMPHLFGLQTITFLQSFGLLILCGALFKSSSSSKDK